MRFGRSLLAGVLAWGGLVATAAAPAAAAAESAGCAATNGSSIFRPPNGYSGGIATSNNYLDHSRAYSAGEKLTLSLADASIEGTMTVTLRNAADTVTYLSVVLVDGVNTTVTLPDGAVGLRFQDTSPAVVNVTNLVISCTAAADASSGNSADVGNDLKQAAKLTTAQTSALAVTSFSSFVNAAVARRFTAGPAGGKPAVSASATGGARDAWTQVASLLPANELMTGVQQALDDGATDQLVLAGVQMADNVLDAADRPFGTWLNGTANFVDYDRAGGAYSGHVLSLGGGADYRVRERLLAGLALTYERGNIDTAFNTGDLDSDGVSIAPYVGWHPLPELTLDANAGISLLDYDTARSGGAVTASYAAMRLFGALNASGDFRFERLRLSPMAGVLYFQERQDAYADSIGTAVAGQTVRLGRFSGGLEAGYTVMVDDAFGIEPYLRIEGEWDFVRPGSVTLTTGEIVRPGQYGGGVAGGFNLFDGSGSTGNIEASLDSIGRDDYDSVTVQCTVSFAF